MYEVQARVITVTEGEGFFSGEPLDTEWLGLVTVPQSWSDADELDEGRKIVTLVSAYYRQVRLIRWLPGGLMEIVV